MDDRYILEDILTSVQAQMHNVEMRLIRVALNGHVSEGVKAEILAKFKYMALQVEKLRTNDS